MVRPFFATCLVSVLWVLLACPAAAVPTATFDENVFRLRVPSGESFSLSLEGGGRDSGAVATHFVVGISRPVNFGPGCRLQPNASFPERLQLWCALERPTNNWRVRYRLRFADGDDAFDTNAFSDIPGVVYAGGGSDEVYYGNRVFGGPGKDLLEGARVHGGAGDDSLIGRETGSTNVLRGGAGDDIINRPSRGLVGGPNWAYGGRGNDSLYAAFQRDMLVGGPGRDVATLFVDDKPDIVRLRGGGADLVRCFGSTLSSRRRVLGERHDIVFADSSDRAEIDCKGTRFLLRGKPRALP